MIALTYKPKRMRGGKRVVGRLYRGKYRLGGESKIHDVALGVCDKQVAEQKLAAIVRDCEKVKFGLIPAQSVRDSLQKPLTEHLGDYVADLRAPGYSIDATDRNCWCFCFYASASDHVFVW